MLVSMSNDVCDIFIPREFESNSAALLYSINLASKKNKDGSLSVDLKKADKMYKFIKGSVNLPDLKPDHTADFYQKSTEMLDTLNEQLKRVNIADGTPIGEKAEK